MGRSRLGTGVQTLSSLYLYLHFVYVIGEGSGIVENHKCYMLICTVAVCFKDLGLHTLSGHRLLSVVRTYIKSLGYVGKLALNPMYSGNGNKYFCKK